MTKEAQSAVEARHEPQTNTGPEEAEAVERQAVSVDVVHEAIRLEGEEELKRSAQALWWSGLGAGLSMGFSMVGVALFRTHLPDAPWRPMVADLGYTLGFLIVILGRQQLFTENTLTPVLPVLRDRSKLPAMLKLWTIVLVANLVGAFLFALVASCTELFAVDVRAAFAALGMEALEPSFGLAVLRAIFAGWLIALVIWLLPSADSAKFWVIVTLTYFVALGKFGHAIAGSVDVFSLVVNGSASVGDYFGRFLLPTLLGNIIGGVSLVALINHAQTEKGAQGEGIQK